MLCRCFLRCCTTDTSVTIVGRIPWILSSNINSFISEVITTKSKNLRIIINLLLQKAFFYVVKLPFQTVEVIFFSKLVEQHFLPSSLAVWFKAHRSELNQGASLLWLIAFLFRWATLSSVVHTEGVALSTISSHFVGVKSVVLLHGTEENDNGIEKINWKIMFRLHCYVVK